MPINLPYLKWGIPQKSHLKWGIYNSLRFSNLQARASNGVFGVPQMGYFMALSNCRAMLTDLVIANEYGAFADVSSTWHATCCILATNVYGRRERTMTKKIYRAYESIADSGGDRCKCIYAGTSVDNATAKACAHTSEFGGSVDIFVGTTTSAGEFYSTIA